MTRGALGGAVVAAVAVLTGLAWWLLGTSSPTPAPRPIPVSPAPGLRGDVEPAPPRPAAGPGGAAEGTPAPAANGLPVDGRVLDFAGRPVAGAKVEAFEWWSNADPRNLRRFVEDLLVQPAPLGRAVSRADGTFALSVPRHGRFSLLADAAGFSPGRADDVLLHPSGRTAPVEIVLGRANGLVVRVEDAAGSPAPGIEVRALWIGYSGRPEGVPTTRLGRTGADGSATLEGLRAGEVVVIARTEDGRTFGRTARVPEDAEVSIRLGGRGAIHLRVRDSSGAPIEGARATAMLQFVEGKGGAMLSGTTGADGTLLWEHLPNGILENLSAEKAGFAPSFRTRKDANLEVPEDGVLEQELVLLPGALVAGTVRTRPVGAPVAGARVVLLQPELPGSGQERTAVADGNGAFRFEAVPPGPSMVFAMAEGLAAPGLAVLPHPIGDEKAATGDSESTILVPEGPAEIRRDLFVVPTTRVSGRVVGPTGSPAGGAQVRLRNETGKQDVVNLDRFFPGPQFAGEDGRFEFPGVPEGRMWVISASSPGLLPAQTAPFAVEANAEVREFEIKLGDGGAIVGRVTGPGGEPIPGALVQVSVRPRHPVPTPLSDTTDADGNYGVHPVPAGTASVSVDADEFIPASRGDLAIAAGVETRADLTLEPALAISGTVRDADGRPAGGIALTAQPLQQGGQGRGRRRQATTDGKGAFRIGGLAPGDYFVTTAQGLHPPATVRSVAAGTRDLAVDLQRAVRISGTVVDQAGAPIAGAKVVVQPQVESGSHGGATTSANGAFTIQGLLAGEYRVRASTPSRSHRDAEQHGVAGGTEGVVLRMEPAFKITGRVLGVDGAPATTRPRVAVLDRAGKQISSTRSDGTGAFELSGLPEGTFTLRASGSDRQEGSLSTLAGSEGVEIRLVAK